MPLGITSSTTRPTLRQREIYQHQPNDPPEVEQEEARIIEATAADMQRKEPPLPKSGRPPKDSPGNEPTRQLPLVCSSVPTAHSLRAPLSELMIRPRTLILYGVCTGNAPNTASQADVISYGDVSGCSKSHIPVIRLHKRSPGRVSRGYPTSRPS